MAKSWEHLLSGYATHTLTEEEKRQLFEAALHDQDLFDALADEEALKIMLADPEVRQRILKSLQKAEQVGEGAHPTEHGPSRAWKGWKGRLRTRSALAWAGSIAAMGLALVFGWQMEKEWGPGVLRDEPVERMQSERKAQDEVAFRSEPAQREGQPQTEALNKKRERGTAQIGAAPQSLPPHIPETEVDHGDRGKTLERLDVPVRQKFQSAEKFLDAAVPLPEEPERPAVVSDGNVEASHSPAEPAGHPLTDPEVVPIGKPEAEPPVPPAGLFNDLAKMKKPLDPPGALDLFYAGLGAERSDSPVATTEIGDQAKLGNMASESLQSGMVEQRRPIRPESMTKVAPSPQKSVGIRYSFIRDTKHGEEEVADGQDLVSDWRKVRLAVEANEAGYFYVLAQTGIGKWQQLPGTTTIKREQGSDDGKLRAFQVVEYRLGPFTNLLGKPVVSSLTVLFAPAPIEQFGALLVGRQDTANHQTERTDDSVYVVRPGPVTDVPLRVDILLEE